MCVSALWDVPTTQIERAVENLQTEVQNEQAYWSRYWKEVASSVDEWARVVIPGTYLLVLTIVFSLDMTDDYLDDIELNEMFTGPGPATIGTGGALRIFGILLVFVAAGFGWIVMNRFSAHDDKLRRKQGRRGLARRVSDVLQNISMTPRRVRTTVQEDGT